MTERDGGDILLLINYQILIFIQHFHPVCRYDKIPPLNKESTNLLNNIYTVL